MATQVRNGKASMAVSFSGEPQNPGFTGTCSQISWNNAFVMPALRQMFGCSESEIITAIEVDNHGIKAQFKRV